MIAKFNKNAKVDKFTNMLGRAVRLIVNDPLKKTIFRADHGMTYTYSPVSRDLCTGFAYFTIRRLKRPITVRVWSASEKVDTPQPNFKFNVFAIFFTDFAYYTPKHFKCSFTAGAWSDSSIVITTLPEYHRSNLFRWGATGPYVMPWSYGWNVIVLGFNQTSILIEVCMPNTKSLYLTVKIP